MNGDVLTKSNFASLYDYHINQTSKLTVAAVEYHVQIPYGVLHTEGQFLQRLEEKPTQSHYCNAGIYVLKQELLDRIPSRQYDMTDLIRDCLSAEETVSIFPVHEYWSDIGTLSELDKTRLFFEQAQEHG
jgi:NDP-sugar pyrophosphorylase family protein